MTLRINSLVFGEHKHITALYEVEHWGERTVVKNDVEFRVFEPTGEVTPIIKVDDMGSFADFDTARLKLADRLERIAAGLREPTESFPIPMLNGRKDHGSKNTVEPEQKSD